MNSLHKNPWVWLIVMIVAGYLITQYISFQSFVIIGIAVIVAEEAQILRHIGRHA
jgi:hypothetical protein